MAELFLITGLGNPGKKYAITRHNAGFLVVDKMADELSGQFKSHGALAQIAQVNFAGRILLLAKPQTFMNLSGQAVSGLLNYFKIPLDNLLVIVDDANLPLGKLRIRPQGSTGGHNGLKSIAEHLNSQNFARLRLGIDSAGVDKNLRDYVLAKFAKAEQEIVNQMLDQAVETIKVFVQDGIDSAMNRFNS
jgi:peptidyl-tRNA hydrolase, PTH1 family